MLTREKGRAQGGEGRVWGREEVCLGWEGADLLPAADALESVPAQFCSRRTLLPVASGPRDDWTVSDAQTAKVVGVLGAPHPRPWGLDQAGR